MDANLEILKEVEITKDELINQIVESVEQDIIEENDKLPQEFIEELPTFKSQTPENEPTNVYHPKNLDNIDNELDFEEEDDDDQSVASLKSLRSDEDGAIESPAENREKGVQDDDEGEASEGEDLEEGEVKEGAAAASAAANAPNSSSPPKPLTCKFYMRGYCQYGANCRFLHPGFNNDKGKYTMFEPPKFPLSAPRPPPRPHFFGPVFRHPFPPGPMPFHARMPMRPGFMPPPRMPPANIEPPVPKESAWERGLRHAKERMKEASRRKEEPDFEEKRLNMTYDAAGGAEEDKEDGFGPAKKSYKDSEDSLQEDAPEYMEDDKYRYDSQSRRREPSKRRHMKRKKTKPISFKEFYEREKAYRKYRQYRKKQKEIKWKKQVYGEYNPSKGSKADEWRDPWRRSKSPHSRRSFSREGSSYSSESFSDRSGSYSGSSFSGSGSYSSGSRSRSPSYPPYGTSPPRAGPRGSRYGRGGMAHPGGAGGQSRKRGLTPDFSGGGGRTKRMRTSPGGSAATYKKQMSPNIKISIKNFSPKKERSSSPVEGKAPTKSPRSASRSPSRSPSRSSGSRSRSGSYSMSVSMSSGSSTSRSPSPDLPKTSSPQSAPPAADNCKQEASTPPLSPGTVPLPPEKVEPVVRFVPSSQDKQHIKLTLLAKKNSLDPSPLDLDVDANPPQDSELPSVPPISQLRGNSSRREELLKQLKAVEDAIARKRVKP